jgi:hypothetical protein
MEHCVQNQSMQQGTAATMLFYIHIFFNKNQYRKSILLPEEDHKKE